MKNINDTEDVMRIWNNLPKPLPFLDRVKLLQQYKKTRDKELEKEVFSECMSIIFDFASKNCKGFKVLNESEREDFLQETSLLIPKILNYYCKSERPQFSSFLGSQITRAYVKFIKTRNLDLKYIDTTKFFDKDILFEKKGNESVHVEKLEKENYEEIIASHLDSESVVREILARLPENKSGIVYDHFFNHYSLSEIAKKNGVTKQDISKLLRKSISQIKKEVFKDSWEDVIIKTPETKTVKKQKILDKPKEL